MTALYQLATPLPEAEPNDTWGSNLQAQINWWAPLYDTTPERALVLFPSFFSRTVENDSVDWNFQDMVKAHPIWMVWHLT